MKKVLKEMKTNNTRGKDEIALEMLKNGGKIVLYTLMYEILSTKENTRELG